VTAQGLSAAALLDTWERGQAGRPAARALELLAALTGSPAAAADVAVGPRDRALFAARRRWFGDRLTGVAECPGCGESVEADLDLGALPLPPPAPPSPRLHAAGCEVLWRAPTAGDLAAVAGAPSAGAARADLLRRCVLEVRRDGQALPPADWPAEALAAVPAALAAADPAADLTLGLTCPGCGRAWEVGLDPGTVLWAEVEHLARRLLGDVHRLADAYGWSEADVLALSAARRAVYVGMCGG
jgi:hypothetical protein